MFDTPRVLHLAAVHPRFNAGHVFVTLGLRAACKDARVRQCLGRHVRGDWGVVPDARAKVNDAALQLCSAIRSSYALDPARRCSETDNCFYIVTDVQRAETLLLLPGEE